MSNSQLSEMVADAHDAINFSKKHFKLPSEVTFKALPKNDSFDFPHYEEATDFINYTYQFGKTIGGKFFTKNRRHARDIFYHEFGHLIFRHNAGKSDELISLYRDHYSQRVQQGQSPHYMSDSLLKEYIQAYNELFADVFAVMKSQNPRAMVSGEYMLYREADLVGKFHAPPKQILRARDFLNKIDVESWIDGEVHITFAPTRSAFSTDPYTIHLFKSHPDKLAKIAFDAINFELRRLLSEDIVLLPSLTVPQLNQRMINTMRVFLQRDQETNLSGQNL